MNLLDTIKKIFSRNKTKQLPNVNEKNVKNGQDESFQKSLEIKDDAFSKLLTQEYIQRIDIDKELLPYFKDEILRIRNYFTKNNFMSIKNYDEFFENYLLDGKLQIKLDNEDKLPSGAAGIYDRDEGQILILDNSNDSISHVLCHELIHFLVMADSRESDLSPSQIIFLDEGYTELISSEIDNICPQSYENEVTMVKFIDLFSKAKNENIRAFLKDEFSFGDESMWTNINNFGYLFRSKNPKNIQRTIINSLIDKNNINSLQDYIRIINQLTQTPYFDKQFMEEFFNDLNTKFLENMKLPVNQNILDLLNNYCNVLYKAETFGNREVIEFDFDDISGSFDKNGNIYGDCPDRITIGCLFGRLQFIELTNNKNTQRFDTSKKFEGINYVERFYEVKNELYTFFNYKEKDDLII